MWNLKVSFPAHPCSKISSAYVCTWLLMSVPGRSLMNNKLSGPLPDLTKLRVKELKLTGNRLNGSIMVDDQAFWETDLAASLHHLYVASPNEQTWSIKYKSPPLTKKISSISGLNHTYNCNHGLCVYFEFTVCKWVREYTTAVTCSKLSQL